MAIATYVPFTCQSRLNPPPFALPSRSSRVSSDITFYPRPTRLKRLEELSLNRFGDGLATSCITCTELLIEGLPFGSGPFSQSSPTVHSGEDGSSAIKLVYVIESGRSLSSTRSFAYSIPSTSEPWEAMNLSSLQRPRDPLRTTPCSKFRSGIFSTGGGPP